MRWFICFIGGYLLFVFLGFSPAMACGLAVLPWVITWLYMFVSSNAKNKILSPLMTIDKAKTEILNIMQSECHGISKKIEQINLYFKAYPQYKLSNWPVFRSWYKAEIDFMMQYPGIYNLTTSDGAPYKPDEDPLYDPEAAAWPCYNDNERDTLPAIDEMQNNPKENITNLWRVYGLAFALCFLLALGFGNSIVSWLLWVVSSILILLIICGILIAANLSQEDIERTKAETQLHKIKKQEQARVKKSFMERLDDVWTSGR